MAKEEQDEKTVNVTYQLKGADAEWFIAYMEREFIEINSVAGKKLTLERLQQLRPQLETARV